MEGLEIACPDVQSARLLAQKAAQWLRLLRYQSHSAAPLFSTSTTCRMLLLIDEDQDEERRAACESLVASLERKALFEDLSTDPRSLEMYSCPMEDIWVTSERGAAYGMIAAILRSAITGFRRYRIG